MTLAQRDRAFRSLKGLERTGATSRVLNLAALRARHADKAERPPAFFAAGALGGALIVKHRLRPGEEQVFNRPRYLATKLIIPFERTDLSLGGRYLFVGQQGWLKLLSSLRGEATAEPHDVGVLEALDELPSLDPFLVREQLKRRGFDLAASLFVLSNADLERMQGFVHDELEDLVRMACGAERVRHETDKLVRAILSGEDDARLEALRGAMQLGAAEYGEGLFCWRGLLYYKWSLTDVFPALREMTSDIGAMRLVGPRSEQTIAQIYDLKTRVACALAGRMQEVAVSVSAYDEAYALLRDRIDPAGFCRFLLEAPATFREVGEIMGVLSHAASYWRYRFPLDAQLLARPDELIEILEEYEAALS